MKKLVVVKSGTIYGYDGGSGTTIADRSDISTLADGALALFGEDGTLLTASTLTTAYNEVAIHEGRTEGSIFHGNLYPREFKVIKSTYAAAVAKIVALGSNAAEGTTYGLNLPAVLVVGSVGGLQIIDKSKRHDDNSRYHNYETTVKSGDTITTFFTRLLGKVTADTKKCIASVVGLTTSSVSCGALFTGNALIDFCVLGTGILANADQLEYTNVVKAGTAGITKGYLSTLTVGVRAFTMGKNTTAQMLDCEYNTNVGLGDIKHLTERSNQIFSLPSRLEPGVNYLTYFLSCKSPDNMGGLIEADNFTNSYCIAVDADDSAIITILDAIFAIMVAQSY
jgi:hypothetical protein